MTVAALLFAGVSLVAPAAEHAKPVEAAVAAPPAHAALAEVPVAKPGPAEALAMLKAGNERYRADKLSNQHCDADRRALAVKEGQAKYAIATVLTCSDSRVPPEHIFDAGIMDLFVIRAAGNPANADEIASIEYGLAHVKTPVLVVMGHSECGAVKAAVGLCEPKKEGDHAHKLEPNIEPLVNGLVPAVQRVKRRRPAAEGRELEDLSIRENVWLAVENLLKKSELTRKLVLDGSVTLAPAIYDLATGEVKWLSEAKVYYYLGRNDTE